MPPATQEDVYVAGLNLRENLKEWSEELIEIFLTKRQQYGDSFSSAAEAFRHPADDEQRAGLRLFLQREYDKLKRIHQTINGLTDAESGPIIEDALRDIVGYVHVIRSFLLSKQDK